MLLTIQLEKQACPTIARVVCLSHARRVAADEQAVVIGGGARVGCSRCGHVCVRRMCWVTEFCLRDAV